MGNVTDKQVLKKYWQNSRRGMTVSRDNREIRKCFDLYDRNRSGALEHDEGIAYINDILIISGLEAKIHEEADANGCDRQQYYQQVLEQLFHEMDRNQTGTIEFDELIRPKVHLWEDFLRFASVQTLHQVKAASTTEGAKPPKRKKKKNGEITAYPTRKKKEDGEDSSEEEYFENIEEDDDGNEEKVANEIARIGLNNIKELKMSHRAMDEQQIMKLRESHVKAVVEFLGVSSTQAQALLASFRWDKEKLLESFVENPEKVCAAAKLPYPLITKSTDHLNSESSSSSTATTGTSTTTSTTDSSSGGIKKDAAESGNGGAKQQEPEEIECTICFCDSSDYTKMESCGHAFCNDCWRVQFETSIKEGQSFDIKCMEKGCPELVPDTIVKSIVSPELWTKYSTFLAKSFVEGNKAIRWCPAPGCGKAIVEKIYEGTFTIGKCSCGFLFCYECNDEAHTPCNCEMLRTWKEKNAKDLSSLRWMLENTKPCPKCKSAIEKNDGCFMMTCRNCEAKFCWLCLQDWSTHSDHFTCSKYNSKDLKNKPEWKEGVDRPKSDQLPAEMFHYMDRVMQWASSLEQTDKSWDCLETKINLITADGGDPSFVIDAFRQLRESRRILKYICIAICVEKNERIKQLNQIFLDSLEMVTEKLGRTLGGKELKPTELRQLTRISRSAIVKLLDTPIPS